MKNQILILWGLLFVNSAAQAQWANSGSNTFFTQSGNLGIGSTSLPSSKVHITGAGGANIDLKVNGRIQTGDANTSGGVWVNSANTMFMGSNGSDKLGFYNSAWQLLVHQNGNIGIGTGTNAPTGKLQVNGRLVIDRTEGGGPIGNGSLLSFSSGASDITAIQENWGLNLGGEGVRPIKVVNASLLVGYTSGGVDYGSGNLLAAGKVGIGTSTPTVKMDIVGSGGFNTDIQVNGRIKTGDAQNYGGVWVNNMFMGQSNSNTIGFYNNNEWRLLVNQNGNVGIGTTTPNAPLQFANILAKRKLVLYEETNNDHQYYGLGIDAGATRFQIGNPTAAFRFFRGNDAASSTEVFTIQGDGKVGVGTATPTYPLQVVGKIGTNGLFLDSSTPAINTPQNAQYLHVYNHLSAANGLKAGGILVSDDYNYAGPGKNDLIVKGKVAIGTPLASNPNNYTLAVNGQIGAKDVRVEATSATWPDYVFEPTYELPSLKEVETYLKVHKHLKEIPSAAEVTENGHNLGEMDALLLKKIEELTLYMINQNKKLETQQQEIQTLKKQLENHK